MAEDETDARIVVGVDGSESSRDALSWAARQARLTESRLHVITAWSYPDHPTPFGVVPHLPDSSAAIDEARRELDELVAAASADNALIDVRAEVVEGSPVPVLLGAARGADLLVLGNRGRGAFADLLLGSVSEHCVRYAPCPVVIVRHQDQP